MAICQMESFPESFGTKLGLHYTEKSLEWFLTGDNRFLFHVYDENNIIAYCGGFQSAGAGDGSTSGMMQYAMKEAAIAMFKKPWLFFNKDIIKFYPLIIKNIFRKLSSRKKVPVHSNETHSREIKIGLVVIGVKPAFRGKGCFELLMKHFEETCKQRNASKMLLSVKATNRRAIAAYKKAGWQTGSETPQALEMYKYIIHE